MSQVQQVIASADGRSAGRAVLYLGDSNLRWSDPEDVPALQAYEAAGFRDACTELSCPDPDHIDRFYLRDGDFVSVEPLVWEDVTAQFLDDDGAELSDHPPLSLHFAWSYVP